MHALAYVNNHHWRRSLLGRVGCGPPTFWLFWAAAISGPPTFLGDVYFFFLYIVIMTGENFLQLPQTVINF